MRIWSELAYPRFGEEPERRRVALLPVGALEAHGPHLPVGADLIIAEAMARQAARLLEESGDFAVCLPALPWTAAPFADEFPGTLSVRPETTAALLVDVARALERRGFACLGIANAHFDPANREALAIARNEIAHVTRLPVAWPDVTRRAFAERLGEEFRSGACHAGRYETSMVLAERPDLVEGTSERLAPVGISLVEAMRAGKRSFRAAGGSAAYFGDPASATAEEGRDSIRVLGEILAEAVRAALHPDAASDPHHRR